MAVNATLIALVTQIHLEGIELAAVYRRKVADFKKRQGGMHESLLLILIRLCNKTLLKVELLQYQ